VKRWALAGVLALGSAACGGAPKGRAACQGNDPCLASGVAGGVCVVGVCLPRVAPPATWSVEVVPLDQSAAGFTELQGVTGAPDAFDLTAAPKVTVTGTLGPDGANAPLQAGRVVVQVPALITGRPDFQLETVLVAPSASGAAPTFTLAVPMGLLDPGRTARIVILPSAPDDATHAPSTFTLPLAPQMQLPAPAPTFTVQGHLQSAFDMPMGGFGARATTGGVLASNRAVTSATDGGFTLLVVPPSGDGIASTVDVTLEPPASGQLPARFRASAVTVTGNVDLGAIHLPAVGLLESFDFAMLGAASGNPPVAGAVVRAHTVLADDPTGTTDFLREGVTGADGKVTLSLFPGSTVAKQPYDIAVVPPPGSPFATTCLQIPLVKGGFEPSPPLVKRTAFAITVKGADGTPIPGASFLARRTASDRARTCDAFTSTLEVSATTDASGVFRVALDPGTWTFDVDPPAGAPYPRHTDASYIVTASSGNFGADTRDLMLAPGAVVEGTVRDAQGNGLPYAGVRFLEPACAATETCPDAPPVLEASVHADGAGHYRAVIPVDGP
jgi:hypothetical protein